MRLRAGLVGEDAMNKRGISILVGGVYLFLYMPILVLVVFSFNHSPYACCWSGFTLHWYRELFQSAEIWEVLKNSLIVACASTLLSLVFGVMVVYGARQLLDRVVHLFYLPILIPEIVLSVGFLYFFSAFNIPLGLPTLITAHTLLGLAFVVPLVHTRFAEMNRSILEASMDLGASEWQTFVRIVLPFLAPSLLSAGLLAWIISFDDFLMSFFCTGSASQTLPLYLYAKIRVSVSPVINALSTLMLLSSVALVGIFSIKGKAKDMV